MLDIEALYHHYRKDLFYYLLSLTHDPALSEDLLSETFLAALHSLSSFQGRSTVKTWLFGIARNIWLKHLRKQRKSIDYKDLIELYVFDSLENKIADQEVIFRIKDLLSTRDQRTQTVVAMRTEGFAYRTIAEQLKISESSARVIDHRTKKWLKTVLEKEGLL